jgi:hypothetical protein
MGSAASCRALIALRGGLGLFQAVGISPHETIVHAHRSPLQGRSYVLSSLSFGPDDPAH